MSGAGRRRAACIREIFRHIRQPGRRAGIALAVSVAALVMSTGCAHVSPKETQVVYLVLRHAEKSDDGTRDPGLSEAGRIRAARIADTLRDAPLDAAYATAYRRTQATAAPTAAAHGLQVTAYEAGGPAESFAAMLRAAHPAGTVLVIGHSNIAPAIAAALCACPVAPMDDDSYGRWIEVRIGPDGRAQLSEHAY